MKIFVPLVLLSLLASPLVAQPAVDSCPYNWIVLNTGWGHKTIDSIPCTEIIYGREHRIHCYPVVPWGVVSDPDPETRENRPVDVVEKHPVWPEPYSRSQWVSAYPTAMNCRTGTYILQAGFMVDEHVNRAWLELQGKADDSAAVYFNGVYLGSLGSTWLDVDLSRFMREINTLEIRLVNTHCEAMGINLRGRVFLFENNGKTSFVPTSLPINSGQDYAKGQQKGGSSKEAHWIVVSDPDPATDEPRRADILEAYPEAWASPFDGSAWMSAYPTSSNPINGIYRLSASFCAEPDVEFALLRMDLRADDSAAVFVNGHHVGFTRSNAYTDEGLLEIHSDISSIVRPGRNEIEIELVNTHSFEMGLNVAGAIVSDAGKISFDRTNGCSEHEQSQ